MTTNQTRPRTTSRYLWAAGLLALATSSSCAGQLDVSEDPAAGGSGGAATSTQASGSGGSNSHAAGAGSEDASSEPCSGPLCDPSLHCFTAPPGATGDPVCAPTCPVQPAKLRGAACSNSITGSDGICAPFLGDLPGDDAVTPMGICSVACDPLAPDCPENFACSLTEAGDGDPIPLMYACLPLFAARSVGSACTGFSLGECAAGSECIQEFGGFTCRAYCDTGDEACPGSQICEKPEGFPEASPVGVCLDAE